MIEKFTPEELEQIKRELGIIEIKTEIDKTEFLKSNWDNFLENNINDIFLDSNIRVLDYIIGIIDYSLCNFERIKTKRRGKVALSFRRKRTIKKDDLEEYEKMFLEILDIIKLHNREYKIPV